MLFRAWRYRPNSAKGYLPKPGGRDKQGHGKPIQGSVSIVGVRLFIFLAVAVGLSWLVAIAAAALIDNRLKPTVIAFAESKGRVAATEAINRAISTRIAGAIKYEDLMAIRTDNYGKVSMVQPNTGEINRLASITVMEVQRSLRSLDRVKFEIPLGQLLGSHVFASVGPRIRVSVIPIGSVTADVTDDFEEAGINQTRHRIYLEVKTAIRVVIPLVHSSIAVVTRVPITEAIVMGDVPEVYLGSGNISRDRQNSVGINVRGLD